MNEYTFTLLTDNGKANLYTKAVDLESAHNIVMRAENCPLSAIQFEGFTKQTEWHGNPELGLDSWMKKFKNPFTHRMTPVYVWGKGTDVSYTVSDGPNSDYSYTGGFYPETKTIEQAIKAVNELYQKGKLIY